ncbi:MAG: 3-keto-5-aminohexanoate cleavage protein [Lachnospiraceae bacterium]|nr:3-keto-5-aminohexanoate cleavage protein [Lachnospiraceae bacterium]
MSDLSRKIIISVAPAARHIDEKAAVKGEAAQVVASVMTPEEIAGDVIACAKNGATLVHMHVRDAQGHLTDDIGEFSRTIRMIRSGCSVIIEGSTGGVGELNAEERSGALKDPQVDVACVNMGSVNLGEGVFANSLEEIRLWCAAVKKRRAVAILQCFEPGMIATVERMQKDGYIDDPKIYGIPMGFAGSQPAAVANMQLLVGLLPKNAVWYYQQHGMEDLSMIAAAAAAGAKIVRVGFEDSLFYAPGKRASSNAELVARCADVIRSIGYEPATYEEACRIIGLKR